MSEILDVPFHTPPFMRMVIKIIESHQEGDITIVDKMEIEKIYIPASADPEYHSSNQSTIFTVNIKGDKE